MLIMVEKMSKIKLMAELSCIEGKNRSQWEQLLIKFIWLLEGSLGTMFFSRKLTLKNIGQYLNLGCGVTKFNGWINADYYNFHTILAYGLDFPDWMFDATQKWKCEDNVFAGIYSEHVIEHIPYSGVVNLLNECYRTLLPGKFIRIIVPDLHKYVQFYNGEYIDELFHFSDRTLALSNLTQNWGHVSVWDKELLCEVLTEIGFVNIKRVDFKEGSDVELLKDSENRRWESLYVEAQKPIVEKS
jgi:predicted SAM-dependent methyltransferase